MNLETTTTKIDTLTPHHRNPRRGNIDAIAQSLQRLGQYRPIVVNAGTHTGRTNEILAGNHTWEAAKKLGWNTIEAVTIDVDEDTANRILIVDNRSSDLGDYDTTDLLAVLEELPDLDATGYTSDDLEALTQTADIELESLNGENEDDETAEFKSVEIREPVTKPGDIWTLGRHSLVCGDSRNPETVSTIVDGRKINLAFTSPPYASQRTYDASSGFKPIPEDDYADWFKPVADNVWKHLSDDGSWIVNIKENSKDGQRSLYVKDLVVDHVREWGWKFIDELIWNHGGTPGKFRGRFKNGFEPVFHFSKHESTKIAHHPENVMIKSEYAFTYEPGIEKSRTGNTVGFHGTDVDRKEGLALPSNVLTLRHSGRGHEGDIKHEAAFPIKLPSWFIRAFTKPHDLVYDPFLGSGTTLIAAQNNDRDCVGVEISTEYCDRICYRWQKYTGIVPERNGEPVDFIDHIEQ